MEIVLASTSPYRRAQLERLGLELRAVPPGVDEEVLKGQGLAPRALAERLAHAKAARVAAREPEAIVIGGDQLVELDGRVMGKPETAANAVAQLALLSGRTHTLVTAIAVLCRGAVERHTDVTRLTMRSLTEAELERYVEADRPLDCAGSYRLESRGIALFERIESEDHSAITGVPLMAVVSILRRLGVEVP
jgi:septum formation protein